MARTLRRTLAHAALAGAAALSLLAPLGLSAQQPAKKPPATQPARRPAAPPAKSAAATSSIGTASRPDPRAEQLQREVQALAEEIEGFERELTDLGIELKDYSLGLIDFPADLNGRMVYLCWRLGEPSVRFWHEPETGYRGRRPLYPALGAGSSSPSSSS